MQSFQAYYSDLYRADVNIDLMKINTFLDSLLLPSLGECHRAELEAPITTEEVLEVIKHLKWGTAPGPDGFPVPYYKAFPDLLAPYLARFLNSKRNGVPLDNQLNLAFISVIPKPDKDVGIVGNYRPIFNNQQRLEDLNQISNEPNGLLYQSVHT